MFLIFHIADFISFLFYDTLTQQDCTSEKGKVKKQEQINYWVYPSNYSGISIKSHVTDKAKLKFTQIVEYSGILI